MKAKKAAALLFAGVMAASLAACGGQQKAAQSTSAAPAASTSAAATETKSTSAATAEAVAEVTGGIQIPGSEKGNTTKTDETITIAFQGQPDYLWHPGAGQASSNEEAMITVALFDRLVYVEQATGEVKPCLAKDWEWIDDYTLQFKLRDDVKMTDGTPLVADDVVYSVNVWMEQCGTNDTGLYFAGAKKIDDTTVQITSTVAAPDMIKMLAWSNFGIVSEDEVKALGGLEAASKNPLMGSGRYKFKEWKVGEYVLLERNEEYWDKDYAGYYKYIKCTALADGGSKAAAVQSGDVQLGEHMPVAQAATFINNPEVRTYIYNFGEVEHVFFNQQEGRPTADPKVREAIAKAIDYNALTTVATAGQGEVALSYCYSGAPYYTPAYPEGGFKRDVEGAKALLKEAGYDEKNPLVISTVSIPDTTDNYTVIQQNLAEAGITLNINNVDMGAFVPAMLIDKDYDICFLGDDTAIRTPALTQFVSGNMCFGGPGVALQDHNDLLTKVMEAKTDGEATKLMAEYDQLCLKDYMCVSVCDTYRAALVGKDVKGFTLRERGFVDITTFFK